MMFYNGFGNGFGCSFGVLHSFWGFGIGLLVIGLVVILLVRNGRNSGGQKSALESLNMRFASGELTEEEYLQRKRVLKGK